MRELKFRAFNGVSFKYSDKTILINTYDQLRLFFQNCNTNVDIVDQYTGLKDANDVEIYENDIVVKDTYGRHSKPMKVEYVGHVIEPFNYGNENEGTILPSDCIVIGNLHQNSDLLK